MACRGPKLSAGRAAPGLRSVLSFGHCCDAELMGLSQLLQAVTWWIHQRQLDGARVRWGDRLRSQAEAIAASLGPWTASARGLAWRGSAFRFEAPAKARTKGLHDLRMDWRCSQMKQWLGSLRIDAVMARGQGLRITP